MAELTRTTAISNLRQKAAPLIEEARRMAQDRRPAGAGSIYRDAAAIMQRGFERLPRSFDLGGEVMDLVSDIVKARVDSAQSFGKLKDYQETSYQLSLAAKCLENFAVQFDQPEKREAVDLLTEALDLRRSAIRYSREEGVDAIHLAFQLSYASRTMMFLRDMWQAEDPAGEVAQMITWRREAGDIFQQLNQYQHAYFEYYFLCGLLYKQGARNPDEIEKRAQVSLLSAEMAEAGRMETFRLARAYRIALKDFRLAGNEAMAQEVVERLTILNLNAQEAPNH
jgi:hypothetical protein